MMRYLLAILLCFPAMAIDYEFVGGSTDKFVLVSMYDSSDGSALTGLVFGDMTITYTRNNAASDVDVTEATMSMGTHADGGFVEVDATNSPGLYQFGIPDAAIADGSESVVFSFVASGAVPKFVHASLLDVDFRNGANVSANTVQIEGSDATDQINAAADTAIADYDGPTNSEMEARTIAAGDYFDPSTDTVANVSTLTGHTPQTADHTSSIAAILADTAAVDTATELRTLLMGANVAPSSSTALATAQSDLDTITGSDGATLATTQGNYAPSKAGDAMDLTAGAVDDIWDEDIVAAHGTADTSGAKLAAAGSSADPWSTALPGAYGAGTAGKILGDSTPQTADHTASIAAILADTAAVDTSAEIRALLTGIDTPVATAAAQSTAQSDLDILTGSDGVTLATTQANYAPATASALAAHDSNLDLVLADTAELQTRFGNMIEADSSDWRFTTNALEQGAAGSGGDATATNQATILDRLAAIMDKDHSLSSAVGDFDPSTDSLEAIKDLGDINWSGSLSGLGSTPVNHDFGGVDELTYEISGNGVEGATVSAYVKSEYDTDPNTAIRRALILTSADGTWEQPMMLNSGTAYTLVFYKPGVVGPDTMEITP